MWGVARSHAFRVALYIDCGRSVRAGKARRRSAGRSSQTGFGWGVCQRRLQLLNVPGESQVNTAFADGFCPIWRSKFGDVDLGRFESANWHLQMVQYEPVLFKVMKTDTFPPETCFSGSHRSARRPATLRKPSVSMRYHQKDGLLLLDKVLPVPEQAIQDQPCELL